MWSEKGMNGDTHEEESSPGPAPFGITLGSIVPVVRPLNEVGYLQVAVLLKLHASPALGSAGNTFAKEEEPREQRLRVLPRLYRLPTQGPHQVITPRSVRTTGPPGWSLKRASIKARAISRLPPGIWE